MKIILNGDTSLTLVPAEGMLTIEADSPTRNYSAFHMLGSALASCTFSVLHSWAEHSKLDTSDLHIHVEWDFAENPHRVSAIRSSIHWPSLPESRLAAAERASKLCGVHATLSHAVDIHTEVQR